MVELEWRGLTDGIKIRLQTLRMEKEETHLRQRMTVKVILIIVKNLLSNSPATPLRGRHAMCLECQQQT